METEPEVSRLTHFIAMDNWAVGIVQKALTFSLRTIIMKFTVTAVTVIPVGDYMAMFVKAEPVVNQYGNSVKLVFQILQGEYQGQYASRTCTTKVNSLSNLFKFLQAFKCGTLDTGEQFDLARYYGITGNIVVEPNNNGGTRVGSFSRLT